MSPCMDKRASLFSLRIRACFSKTVFKCSQRGRQSSSRIVVTALPARPCSSSSGCLQGKRKKKTPTRTRSSSKQTYRIFLPSFLPPARLLASGGLRRRERPPELESVAPKCAAGIGRAKARRRGRLSLSRVGGEREKQERAYSTRIWRDRCRCCCLRCWC
jgi:hypothetical protein